MQELYDEDLPIQLSLFPSYGATLDYAIRRHVTARPYWDFQIKANRILYSWFLEEPPSLDPDKWVKGALQEPSNPKSMLSERKTKDGPTLVEDRGGLAPISAFTETASLILHRQVVAGKMRFLLDGALLRGAFSFRKLEDHWLFQKLPDEHASTTQPEWTGRSIITGKTLADL